MNALSTHPLPLRVDILSQEIPTLKIRRYSRGRVFGDDCIASSSRIIGGLAYVHYFDQDSGEDYWRLGRIVLAGETVISVRFVDDGRIRSSIPVDTVRLVLAA